MAMSKEEQLDLTRCSICFEIFNVPKQLPCLHSFCESCLQSYITEIFNKDSVKTKGILCPICRVFIDKPEDQDFQEWGKRFPTNHLMNNIIDYTKSKNESTVCNVCGRDNENKTASHWCVNCSDALCTQCERQHRRFKTTAPHKLVEIDKMRELGPEGLFYGAEVFCDEHQNESIRFYCADHKCVCCMTCMMLRHRKCDDVGSVEDGANTVKTSKEVEGLEQELKGLKTGFEALVDNRTQNIQSFKIMLEDTKKCIKTSFDDVFHLFENAKSKIIEELGAKEKEIIPQLQDEKSELECKVAGISNDLAILESNSRHAPPARYIQTIRSLLKQREKLKLELKKQTNQLRNHDLEYTPNDTLATLKEVENLLGNFSVLQTQNVSKQDVESGIEHFIKDEKITHFEKLSEPNEKINSEECPQETEIPSLTCPQETEIPSLTCLQETEIPSLTCPQETEIPSLTCPQETEIASFTYPQEIEIPSVTIPEETSFPNYQETNLQSFSFPSHKETEMLFPDEETKVSPFSLIKKRKAPKKIRKK